MHIIRNDEGSIDWGSTITVAMIIVLTLILVVNLVLDIWSGRAMG